MEPRDRRDSEAAEGSHASPALPGAAQAPLHLLLSHGPPPRRRQELVHRAHRRTRPADERARPGRTPLLGRSPPDHHRLHRLRRLGVGRRPVCRRPAGIQEADLRNALRRSLRRLRPVRRLLRRSAGDGGLPGPAAQGRAAEVENQNPELKEARHDSGGGGRVSAARRTGIPAAAAAVLLPLPVLGFSSRPLRLCFTSGKRRQRRIRTTDLSHFVRETRHTGRSMRLIEYNQASPEVRAVYDDIMSTRKTDWINNFWKALAHDPATLRRTWESIKQIMAPGALDPLTKEMIYVAVSVSNQCGYCIASHTAAARKKGMSDAMFHELMAVVGMANESNRLAAGYQVEIDEQFKT